MYPESCLRRTCQQVRIMLCFLSSSYFPWFYRFSHHRHVHHSLTDFALNRYTSTVFSKLIVRLQSSFCGNHLAFVLSGVWITAFVPASHRVRKGGRTSWSYCVKRSRSSSV